MKKNCDLEDRSERSNRKAWKSHFEMYLTVTGKILSGCNSVSSNKMKKEISPHDEQEQLVVCKIEEEEEEKYPMNSKDARITNTTNNNNASNIPHHSKIKKASTMVQESEYRIKRQTCIPCPCDYNPLCLPSMGGAVDDYINRILLGHKELPSQEFNKQTEELQLAWEKIVAEDSEERAEQKHHEYDRNNSKLNETDSNHKNTTNIKQEDSDIDIEIVEDHDNPLHDSHIIPSDNEKHEGIVHTKQVHYDVYVQEVYKKVKQKSKQFYKLYHDSNNRINGVGNLDAAISDRKKDGTIRQSIKISREKIRSYLEQSILTGRNNKGKKKSKEMPSDEAQFDRLMIHIRERHQSLLFPDSLKLKDQLVKSVITLSSEKEINFCKPVGLKNLGATCYLNSQLQCLSTNLLFLQGLFQWNAKRSVLTNKNTPQQNQSMLRAISEMQLLLATMSDGAKNVVCTENFASSLGLVPRRYGFSTRRFRGLKNR